VAEAVKLENVTLPSGTLYGAHQAFTVQATGQLTTAAAYRPLVVAYRGGAPVRLSDVGEGTMVRVDKAQVSDETHPHIHVHRSVRPDGEEQFEMVVDDEDEPRDLASAILRQCGAEVRTAATAAQALQAFKDFRPDVFVSDISMPGEDGLSLIRKIRALEHGRGVPAAALTASSRVEDRTRVLLAGFQIYVSKPVEPVELAAVVGNLAGRTLKAS